MTCGPLVLTPEIIIIIRGATALTNLGRLNSRRWQFFPAESDGTGLTCGQHIESHSCIFSFPNRDYSTCCEEKDAGGPKPSIDYLDHIPHSCFYIFAYVHQEPNSGRHPVAFSLLNKHYVQVGWIV
jgi:hypothetical protein